MMNIAKIKPKHIYLFFLFLMGGVVLLSYARYKMHLNTRETGEHLKVRISEVVCKGDKKIQNYIVFRGQKGNEIVNVGKQACVTLQAGDSLEILYNREFDLYFPTYIDTSDDVWGMVGGGIFMMISILFLILPNIFKNSIGSKRK